jgi:hypothetical protein
MGTTSVKGWGITGSRVDAYSAERTEETQQRKAVVRLWRSAEGADGFGSMFQLFKPDAYRGKRVRYSAAVRTVDVVDRAALCIRVDSPDTGRSGRSLAFDNMEDRPHISGTTGWSRYSCVVDVPREATAIFISSILFGAGELFWSDVRIEIVDDSVPVTDMLPKYAVGDEPMNLDFSET